MQEFIAYGRISSIPNGAYGKTAMQRKQVQAGKASHIPDDPIPMDVDSPF